MTRAKLMHAPLVALLLAGCDASPPPRQPEQNRSAAKLVIHTDVATGCQYLSLDDHRSAPTPRLHPNGRTVLGCHLVQDRAHEPRGN